MTTRRQGCSSPELEADPVEQNFKKSDKLYQEITGWDVHKIWGNFHRLVFDAQGPVKKEIRKLGIVGEKLVRTLELAAGGGARGDVEHTISFDSVFEGIKEHQFDMLNRIIQALRNISLEENWREHLTKLTGEDYIGTTFDLSNKEDKARLEKAVGKPVKAGKKFTHAMTKKVSIDSDQVSVRLFVDKVSADTAAEAEGRRVAKQLEILNPDALTKEQYEKWLKLAEAADPELYNAMRLKAEDYFAVMRRQIGFLERAGILSKEKAKDMIAAGDYSPRLYMQFFDPDITFNNLEQIKTGSTQPLLLDSALLMRDYIVRAHDRIARNEANLELLKIAESHPDNPIVQKISENEAKHVSANFKVINAMVKGEKVPLKMPLAFAEQWGQSDPSLDRETAKLLQHLSGASIVRASATGLNPEFALTNLPRDMFFSWFRTREYSDNVVFAPFQILARMVEVSGDVWHTGNVPIGRAKEFLDDGGMMEFMTSQGLIVQRQFKGRGSVLHPKLKALEGWLSFLGQKTELWVRLALREQAIHKRTGGDRSKLTTDIRKDATWIARGYLDFAQGGKLTKGADRVVPYLNAGMQATRGLFQTLAGGHGTAEQIRDNKWAAWWKFAQFTTLFGTVFMLNLLHYPDDMEKIDDGDKQKNLIWFLPGMEKKAANGETIRAYIKLPMDQGQSAMANAAMLIFSQALKGMLGEGDTVFHRLANTRPEIFGDGAKSLIPFVNTLPIPPILDAIIAANNLDTFGMQEIWKGADFEDKNKEYTPFTHPAWRMQAKVLNKILPNLKGLIPDEPMSPERLKFVMQTFFTPSNSAYKALSYATDVFFGEMMADYPDVDKHIQKSTREWLKTIPGADRIIEWTNDEKVRKRVLVHQEKQRLAGKRQTSLVETNILLNKLNEIEQGDNVGAKRIREQLIAMVNREVSAGNITKDEGSKLKKRYVSAHGVWKTLGRIGNARLWREVAREPSRHARGVLLFKAWKDGTPEYRENLKAQYRKMKRVNNRTTSNAWGRLMQHHRGERDKP